MTTKTPVKKADRNTKEKKMNQTNKKSDVHTKNSTTKKASKKSTGTKKTTTTKHAVKATSKTPAQKRSKKTIVHHASKGAALKGLAQSSKVRSGATAHKRVSKKTVAAEEECFWINNGAILHTLAELARAMHEISDEQFWYHVRSEQNDFARWVEDVFGERALARKIERAKSRTGTYRVVVAHVSLNT